MSGICLPIDASAGSPSFPAAQHRAADSMFGYPVSGRPLGARSGIRPGATPSLSLVGSNWTLTPFSAEVDPGTGLAVGPYRVAFLANETGTLNPADGTNPRIDRLDVQVPDDPPGASPRTAVVVYTAGVAASTPAAPGAPARSFPLGTFSVPKATTGNPSWTPAPQLTVAPGGILPASASAYGNGLYVGQYLDDPTSGLMRWDGAAWQKFGLGGDTGWLTLPVGLSYNTASTALMRLKQGTVRMKKLVQLNSGANFPTSSDNTVISTNGIPAAFRPPEQVNFILSASNVASSVRGFVNSDGSMHFVTQATTGAYVDVAGVRYDVD